MRRSRSDPLSFTSVSTRIASSKMSARLERLLRLVSAASNSLIRSQAAEQVADILEQEPEQLRHILKQVSAEEKRSDDKCAVWIIRLRS
jgi:hypothetical protein